MARDVARWLARKERLARTVTIKVRYDDFTTITRSLTVLPPTSDEAAIATRAVALLDRTEAGTRPVRLLGVGVHNLSLLGEEAGTAASKGDAAEPAVRRARSGRIALTRSRA